MIREERAIQILEQRQCCRECVCENCTCAECDEAFDMAIKALEQEPRWIPVSERLPKEREWIGTKRFGTTISDEVYVTLETSDGKRFTKHLSFQNGELSVIDKNIMEIWFNGAVPIAWMPLPQPYREVEE